MRKVSLKRQKLNRERREFVSHFLAAHPWCQAELQNYTRRAVDVHERLNRSQGGEITGKDSHGYLALCRNCHMFITDNPRFSYEMGFSVHPWD